VPRDPDASPFVHPQHVVAPPPFRHGDLDHLARRQQAVVARRRGVHQRRALARGEQRRRPPLLRRRAEGAEDVHPSVHAAQQPALDHPLDLPTTHARRPQLLGCQAAPLTRGNRTKCTYRVRFVRHGSILARNP
jgi:hypothetical protein